MLSAEPKAEADNTYRETLISNGNRTQWSPIRVAGV